MENRLAALIREAKAKVAAMTPAEREQMHRAQAESWARAFAPCEHGMVDFEDCEQCRAKALTPQPSKGKGE